jgi:hypothetical protein
MNQIKSNPKIDYDKDWKLVTVLIGANNLCASCIEWMNPFDTAAEFGASIDKTLDTLTTMPRTLVNVVQLFNLSSVYEVSKGSPYCKNVHQDFPLECECDFSSPAHVRLDLDFLAHNQLNWAICSSFWVRGTSINEKQAGRERPWTVLRRTRLLKSPQKLRLQLWKCSPPLGLH